MNEVWLITGLPGAGKTTVARLLGAKMDRAAHIEGDLLRRFIVAGGAWPGHGPAKEAERQTTLNIRSQSLLARSFSEAGFLPVLDYLVVSRKQLDEYREHLRGMEFRFVVLAPKRKVVLERDKSRAAEHGHAHEDMMHLADVMAGELQGVGLWLDTSQLTPDQTAEEVRRRAPKATVR